MSSFLFILVKPPKPKSPAKGKKGKLSKAEKERLKKEELERKEKEEGKLCWLCGVFFLSLQAQHSIAWHSIYETFEVDFSWHTTSAILPCKKPYIQLCNNHHKMLWKIGKLLHKKYVKQFLGSDAYLFSVY